MGKLFGTDGVRGIANLDLTCELATDIGRAAAMALTDDTHQRPKILIGDDTRVSADMLVSALAAGLCSVGADVMLLGSIPTPAVAYLVKKYGYDAGIMVSASHNPCEYNGIKIFKSDGYKLDDALEDEIESIVLYKIENPPKKTGSGVGRISRAENAAQDYIKHIISTSTERFDGIKVAIDCANGAASTTAEKLFISLGADCVILNARPDGVNINDGCGSMHVDKLCGFVTQNGCDLGLAFDGDADRMLAVDEAGEILYGDVIMAILALDMKKRGLLAKNTAVATVYSNMGLMKFGEENDIRIETTKTGDRYVLENMLKNGYSLGGEQSGHIIFSDYATTGDGQLSGVQLLGVIKRSGKKLSELAGVMKVYPQVLKNLELTSKQKEDFLEDEEIKHVIYRAERELEGDGRVLVRLSGTEPLVRVMLEGPDPAQIEELCGRIIDEIKTRLG